MRATDANRPTQPDFPFARQARGFMHVAVKRKERLPRVNKSPYRDTANMQIERDVLVRHAVKTSTIERGIVRRSVE